jgi:hypothetical protein
MDPRLLMAAFQIWEDNAVILHLKRADLVRATDPRDFNYSILALVQTWRPDVQPIQPDNSLTYIQV